MKNKNIKNLLDKYIHGKLDREELDFLYQSVNHHLHDKEILAWYYRYWDESESKSGKIRSSEVWDQISEKIGLPGISVFSLNQKQKNKKTWKILMHITIKYAATLVLGFILALLFLKREVSLTQDLVIRLNQVSIPLGSKSKIVLADGSQVWLNSGSTLKYPTSFTGKEREIYLSGEAFFDITRKEDKPFIVKTSEINIRVLGTKFNVKSYPEENTVEATVISGIIEIETHSVNSNQKQHLKLESNQQARFAKASSKLDILIESEKPQRIKPKPVGRIMVAEKINTEAIIAWKEEKLVFVKERFEDILIKLERWYDVEIILEDDRLRDYTYTGTFQNESLEQALDALKLATPFDYSIDKNNIIIFSRGK